MFEVLYEWAEQGGGRYVWSAVAFAKDRANPIPDTDRADYAASGQVALQIDNRDGSLRGVGGMTFSDRLKLLNGAYGTGPRDRWEIALHRDGAVEIRLLDWGGATMFLEQVNYLDFAGGQFVTGFLRDGNGTGFVTISVDRAVRESSGSGFSPGLSGGSNSNTPTDMDREEGAFSRADAIRDRTSILSDPFPCVSGQHSASSPDRKRVLVDGRLVGGGANDVLRMGFSPQCINFFADYRNGSNSLAVYNLEGSTPQPVSGSPHTGQYPFDQIWFSPDETVALVIRPSGAQNLGDTISAWDLKSGTKQGQNLTVGSRVSLATLRIGSRRLLVDVTPSIGNKFTLRLG